MLLQFLPDGSVQFTRSPQALDLFKGEHLSIKRMTEIIFSERLQGFYIKFITGPLAPYLLTNSLKLPNGRPLWNEYMRHVISTGVKPVLYPNVFFGRIVFDEYEQAVATEIKLVDFLRAETGASFAA